MAREVQTTTNSVANENEEVAVSTSYLYRNFNGLTELVKVSHQSRGPLTPVRAGPPNKGAIAAAIAAESAPD